MSPRPANTGFTNFSIKRQPSPFRSAKANREAWAKKSEAEKLTGLTAAELRDRQQELKRQMLERQERGGA